MKKKKLRLAEGRYEENKKTTKLKKVNTKNKLTDNPSEMAVEFNDFFSSLVREYL
jgi:hypothetical protein